MKRSAPRCPVPVEQLPIREYEEMRESWFYSWGARDLRGYTVPVLVVWGLSWLVSGPIAAASYAPTEVLNKFLISAALGALVVPALTLLQLYVGWSHVGQRLQIKDLPYEESGWYDGQIWTKPDDIFNRDRLIVDYQVRPILNRLRKTFGIMAGCLVLGMFGWSLF
ncbi:protein ycf36 [Leptolyngbya sp. Heron Island J]|uniref:CGLD27 family protein n=1 Tax=Leptolyngbya sp. Heron Island J TaxID=1385935 RepID=UPI0003B945D2|nr:CGLD27 family protein [Leptolyngbya sp. Heron Island J]ESA35070.1 protein ycf36 [Leptolyngbya sp. Heron Island J]